MAAVKQQFLQLLETQKEGVSDAKLKETFAAEYAALVPVINDLSSQGRLKLFQSGSGLVYQLVPEGDVERFRGLGHEHMLVYQEIEKAGDMGIWTRDIKIRTNLQQQTVTKALRLLESKKLIKAVRSITSKNKKVYMLFDLNPSREITGGPWYTEQEFDHAFIDSLRRFIISVLKEKGLASLREITEQITLSGISKVKLGPEEVMSIISILLYDGEIEELAKPLAAITGNAGDVNYKVSTKVHGIEFAGELPCGKCPVVDMCAVGNTISPVTCQYFDDWLVTQESMTSQSAS